MEYFSYYTQLFGLGLLGLFMVKSRLHLKTTGPWNSQESRTFALLLTLFTLLSILTTYMVMTSKDWRPSLLLANETLCSFVSIGLFLVLYRTGWGGKILDLFIPVGKMSLTAYLLHTTAFSFFFYQYDFGQFGRIGPAKLLPLSLLFYGGVFLLCHFWLRRFSLGPLEWVLRGITYGQKPPGSRFIERTDVSKDFFP